MIDIIVIEPENSGNVGAIARVMKNFGFMKLVLVNPKVKIDHEMRCRAKHANDVLDKCKILDFDALKKFDYLIGTTSKIGSDYNMPRVPVMPEILAKNISGKKGKFGLIFGREGVGLTNSEIEICDYLVTIPTNKKYPALNLSHSVAIILYELSRVNKKNQVGMNIKPISLKEKQVILGMTDDILGMLKFSTKEKKETQELLWKRTIGKAMLSKREAFALMGFFQKILRSLKSKK